MLTALASTDSSLYISKCVCVCLCVRVWWGEKKTNHTTSPGETDWGSYLMLFMKESCPPCQISLSLLSCAFISPSSLYSSFSFLSHLLTPPAPSPVFHLSGSPHLFSESIRISLWTVFYSLSRSFSVSVHVEGIRDETEILALQPKQAHWLEIFSQK